MVYTVSITSQGQISIPAKIRRELGLDKKEKALVSIDQDRIIVEPVEDFLQLEGSLKHKVIKGKSIQEIIRLEKEAVAEAVVERYKRSLGK